MSRRYSADRAAGSSRMHRLGFVTRSTRRIVAPGLAAAAVAAGLTLAVPAGAAGAAEPTADKAQTTAETTARTTKTPAEKSAEKSAKTPTEKSAGSANAKKPVKKVKPVKKAKKAKPVKKVTVVAGLEDILTRAAEYDGQSVDPRTGAGWRGMSDRLAMRVATDATKSGYPDARTHWRDLRKSGRLQTPDTEIPAGALVFFDTSEPGHAVVYLGGGKVFSTGADGAPNGVVPLAQIQSRGRLVGWAHPAGAKVAQMPAPKLAALVEKIGRTAPAERPSGRAGDRPVDTQRGPTVTVVPGVEAILTRVATYDDETVDARTGRAWNGMCDRLGMRVTTDSTTSGYADARSHWTIRAQQGLLHTSRDDIPVGALVFFDTSSPHGHTAIYVGAGNVLTTQGNGAQNDIVSFATMESWGRFVGWVALPDGEVTTMPTAKVAEAADDAGLPELASGLGQAPSAARR